MPCETAAICIKLQEDLKLPRGEGGNQHSVLLFSCSKCFWSVDYLSNLMRGLFLAFSLEAAVCWNVTWAHCVAGQTDKPQMQPTNHNCGHIRGGRREKRHTHTHAALLGTMIQFTGCDRLLVQPFRTYHLH